MQSFSIGWYNRNLKPIIGPPMHSPSPEVTTVNKVVGSTMVVGEIKITCSGSLPAISTFLLIWVQTNKQTYDPTSRI